MSHPKGIESTMSKRTPPQGRTPARRRWAAGVGAFALGAGVVAGGAYFNAAQAADALTFDDIVLGVGSNETQRYVTWYASGTDAATAPQAVKLSKTADLEAGEFDGDAVTVQATVAANTVNGTTSSNPQTGNLATAPANGKALLTDLAQSTEYTYAVVGSDGSTSPKYTFKTGKFGKGDFNFAFVGDPQLGASSSSLAQLDEDTAGWNQTLAAIAGDPSGIELLTSAGDQVETTNAELQYRKFLSSDIIRSIPFAVQTGNHEAGNTTLNQHFAVPNQSKAQANNANGVGNYWYVYKDVLFLNIDSNFNENNDNAGNRQRQHMAWIEDAIKSAPATKWRIVTFHHSLYSPASHHDDTDIKWRRPAYTKGFSDLGIDLVLQGHDHAYSRSYVLKNSGAGADRANPAEQPGASSVVSGPGGVIYVTSNSASGSKYYDLNNPSASTTADPNSGAMTHDATRQGKYPAETMTHRGAERQLHWTNSVENQDYQPTYVRVRVTDQALTLENVVSGICDYPNKQVTKNQVAGCGATQAPVTAGEDGVYKNTDGRPVGTTQDYVSIRKDGGRKSQNLSVYVPNRKPGVLGVELLADDDLVALGDAVESANGSHFQAKGPLDRLEVTDTRTKGDTSWDLSAKVEDFVDGDTKVEARYLGWQPRIVSPGAGAEAGAPVASAYDGVGEGLSVSRTMASAATGHAEGKAKVGADLSLKFPTSLAGDENQTFWSKITFTLM